MRKEVTEVTVPDVLSAIAHGTADDDLDRVIEGCRARRKIVQEQRASEVMAHLRAGDIVEIPKDAGIRPKYLLGTEWSVKELLRTEAVLLPHGTTAFFIGARYQGGLRCNAGILRATGARVDGESA